MSAFIVQDATINRAIATIATSRDLGYVRDEIKTALGIDLDTEAGCVALGQAMAELNDKGIDARYGDGTAAGDRGLPYQYRVTVPPTVAQALKHLSCWHYQCSEGSIPKESLLYATLERVQGLLALHIVNRLPQYEAARWDARESMADGRRVV